ncbi:hypothetical protein Q8A67_023129 [Cirrhinus molitorella]|uniref:Uncharacterized protein n=1 Tax=Cirrhinus molitorella TaxID=172907 RepID=A0AA88P4K8_9TELE|nr:hypothetical protein Q8A67_023129 [Cirrhinus molitorella]
MILHHHARDLRIRPQTSRPELLPSEDACGLSLVIAGKPRTHTNGRNERRPGTLKNRASARNRQTARSHARTRGRRERGAGREREGEARLPPGLRRIASVARESGREDLRLSSCSGTSRAARGVRVHRPVRAKSTENRRRETLAAWLRGNEEKEKQSDRIS